MELSPEAFATRVASGPIAHILQGALDGVTSLPSFLRKKAEIWNFFNQVTYKYAAFCLDIFRNIRVLGMSRPIALQQIYTQVRIADEIQRNLTKSFNELRAYGASKNERRRRSVLSALKVARTRPRVVLLGRPGSGKSTFLRYFLLRELSNVKALEQIPVLVVLNQLREDTQSIRQMVSDTFKNCGVEFADTLTENLLKSGKLRLLIDGLDELPFSQRMRVTSEIELLMMRFRKCSFIITCRSAAYEHWFGDCHHYEVEPFSERAIESFVRKWFVGDRGKADEVVRQLLSSPRLVDLCCSPLMLVVVCVGFSSNISDSRAEIYKDAIDVLLRKWDSSRRIYREATYKSLTPKRREDLLAELAARTFVQNSIIFSEATAVRMIHDFLASMPPDLVPSGVAADSVLRTIEAQHGLLEKRSTSFWAFAHLTFHEYFVAQYLAAQGAATQEQAIARYIDRPEWREILMLTASLLPNADNFVLQILRSIAVLCRGTFFIHELNQEIDRARDSMERWQHDAQTLFPEQSNRVGGRTMLSSHKPVRLVEVSESIGVVEMRQVLDAFRKVTAARLNRAIFYDFWDQKKTDDQAFARTHYPTANVWPEGSFGRAAMHAIEDLLKMRETRVIHVSSKVDGLLAARDAARAANPGFLSKLDAIFSSNSIFELTDRKFAYLLPGCVEECIERTKALVSELNMDIVEPHLLQHWGPPPPGGYAALLSAAIEEETSRYVRMEANLNATQSERLRSFMVGETLADILLSQVFLTPAVRKAAVNALLHIVQEFPPEGPKAAA